MNDDRGETYIRVATTPEPWPRCWSWGLAESGCPWPWSQRTKASTWSEWTSIRIISTPSLAGAAPFEEPGLGALLERHVGQRFRPMAWSETTEADLSDVEWVVLTVGVHDLPFPEPANLATLHGVVAALIEREALRGRTMILRTTLPVGTTHAIASHVEERHGLIEGEDYHLAFVPERLVEGQAIEEERRLPKIVGPMSHGALVAAEALFSKIGGRVIPVAGPKEAEFVKLIDNAWRHTRFAFANDAAVAASAMGVDVIDVIEAANADYDRNAVARPGPVSGYCLGKDDHLRIRHAGGPRTF